MEKIKVSIRIRPLNQNEKQQYLEDVWSLNNNSQNLRLQSKYLQKFMCQRSVILNKASSYDFDKCFGIKNSNYEIFTELLKDLVHSSLQGFNGTLFMYGQTGAGKTFTMLGGAHHQMTKDPNIHQFIKNCLLDQMFDNLGVLIYSMMELFKMINKDSENYFNLKCSYYEIYNENVYDLLAKNPAEYQQVKQIYMDKQTVLIYFCMGNQQEFELRQISEVQVTSLDQVIDFIKRGEKNRHYAETVLNQSSSRSHTIFKLQIEIFKEKVQLYQSQSLIKSKLIFVDLAGSERLNQINGEDYNREDSAFIRANERTRVRESQIINKSLFYLTQVISLLVKKDTIHVPFRNSALTKLLKGSLSGNSKTVILLCINPTVNHIDQSLQTLQFGENAKLIENKVEKNIIEQKIVDQASIKDLLNKFSEMQQSYIQQKQELQQIQGQLKQTLIEKERLIQNQKVSPNQSIENRQIQSFLLIDNITMTSSQSDKCLSKLKNMVLEQDGSIIIERYKLLLQQLQAQQHKNKQLEDECRRLNVQIIEQDSTMRSKLSTSLNKSLRKKKISLESRDLLSFKTQTELLSQDSDNEEPDQCRAQPLKSDYIKPYQNSPELITESSPFNQQSLQTIDLSPILIDQVGLNNYPSRVRVLNRQGIKSFSVDNTRIQVQQKSSRSQSNRSKQSYNNRMRTITQKFQDLVSKIEYVSQIDPSELDGSRRKDNRQNQKFSFKQTSRNYDINYQQFKKQQQKIQTSKESSKRNGYSQVKNFNIHEIIFETESEFNEDSANRQI